MLFESNFNAVILISMGIVLIFTVGYKFWKGKPKDDLDKAIINLNITLFSLGFLTFIMWIMLPTSAMLKPFGIPETIGDMQSNKQLLTYASDLGLVAERTRDVLYFFFLFFVFGFLGAIYQVTKAYNSIKEKDGKKSSVD